MSAKSSDAGPHNPSLRFASLAAHQMRSPVDSVRTILRTLLGEFVGELTDQQRELIHRAETRCEQAAESVQRMLAIVNMMDSSGPPSERTDLADLVRRAATDHAEQAHDAQLELTWRTDLQRACVPGSEGALAEVVDALLENALKYTPASGRVTMDLVATDEGESVRLVVADSGPGIPAEERDRVFEPFYRASAAKGTSHKGTGLGLSFVQAVVANAGGSVRVEDSSLGGAAMVVTLPVTEDAPSTEALEDRERGSDRDRPMRVLIVGGVAAGPKAAAKVIRLCPNAEVTVVEKGQFMSYAGCGLPYYLSGAVGEQRDLMSTPVGAVRDPVFFQKVKNVSIISETEVTEIDRTACQATARNVVTGRTRRLSYDRLILATGAQPIRPSIPNSDLDDIFTLHGVQDAEGIKAHLTAGRARDVVIVGGGLIGVEVTEALVRRGCRVTVVEMQPQILRILDEGMARLVASHMESRGVRVLTGTKVLRFDGGRKVQAVVTEAGTIPAELVILGIGVRPNVALAEQCGLEIGPTGAIRVDEQMRTSDPNIYAAGDCAETTDLVTGRPAWVPLGSTANKQARVAAQNVCGRTDRFPGVLGSTVCKVFDYCVGRTGLTEAQACRAGFDPVTVLTPAPDRAHYMPDARMLLLKLVVDRPTRRLLGAQAVGPGAGDKRIDVAAMAISAGMTVDELANADLCYAPPYSPALDNILTAANVARNKLDGHLRGITPAQLKRLIDEGVDVLLIDIRTPAEYERVRLPGAKLVPLGTLRGRLRELPRDRLIVPVGQISLRGYEAALVLAASGFEHVRVLDGGVEMWPYARLYG